MLPAFQLWDLMGLVSNWLLVKSAGLERRPASTANSDVI